MKSLFSLFCLTLVFFGFGKPAMAQSAEDPFVVDAAAEHAVILILSEKWAVVKEVAAEVVKHNVTNYPELELSVNRYKMPYLSPIPVLYISKFPNKAAALDYYDELMTKKANFMQMNIVESAWAFSMENFNLLLLKKSLEEYRPFFSTHYRPLER
jgi:hypothetical protein